MHDAVQMGMMHGPGQGLDQCGGRGGGLGLAGQMLGQQTARDIFQGEVGSAVVFAHSRRSAHDIQVGPARRPPPPRRENGRRSALGAAGVQNDLQGDLASQERVFSLEDDPHAAAAQDAHDPVACPSDRGSPGGAAAGRGSRRGPGPAAASAAAVRAPTVSAALAASAVRVHAERSRRRAIKSVTAGRSGPCRIGEGRRMASTRLSSLSISVNCWAQRGHWFRWRSSRSASCFAQRSAEPQGRCEACEGSGQGNGSLMGSIGPGFIFRHLSSFSPAPTNYAQRRECCHENVQEYAKLRKRLLEQALNRAARSASQAQRAAGRGTWRAEGA